MPNFSDAFADHLHTFYFREGKTLALLSYLGHSLREEWSFLDLPDWVIIMWSQIGAIYYLEGVDRLALTSEQGMRTLPDSRALKTLRTLDQIAGIQQGKKKLNAWQEAARLENDIVVSSEYSECISAARTGKHIYFEGPNGAVTILNNQGKPTKQFTIAFGKRHQIVARENVSDAAYYQAIRRIIKRVSNYPRL